MSLLLSSIFSQVEGGNDNNFQSGFKLQSVVAESAESIISLWNFAKPDCLYCWLMCFSATLHELMVTDKLSNINEAWAEQTGK